jgi:C-terminal processing protease CtpA/Prc
MTSIRAAIVSLATAVIVGPFAAAAEPPDQPVESGRFATDFEAAWKELDRSYAYFDEKTTDWQAVHDLYRREVLDVADNVGFLNFLERFIEELYDFHLNLSLRNAASPALVPAAVDCWAGFDGGRAMVTAVRPATPASRAGIRPGMEIVRIDGRPVVDALRERLGRCGARGDPSASDWALIALLAGRGDARRHLTIAAGGTNREFSLEPCSRPNHAGRLLEHRIDDAGIGIVRFHDSLGDNATVAAFDEAMDKLTDTEGLILDLRDTPSGGNTTVARGIMGRLVGKEAAYQKHLLASEERTYGVRRSWVELVTPRGTTPYTAPVVVLVDRWTASMGEGLAIGLDGLGRATVVGTRMAGLLGGTCSFTLPETGIVMQYPCEKLFHVDGTPRAAWVPPVEVDLRAMTDPACARRHTGDVSPGIVDIDAHDPILEAGVARLRSLGVPPPR